jgi:hypothetical protein
MRIPTTLPEQFANIVDILKNRPMEEQTLNSISTILIEHETTRALRDNSTGSNPNLAGTSGKAMVANAKGGKYRGKYSKGKDNGGCKLYDRKPGNSDTSDIVCYYCTKRGHKAIDCHLKAKAAGGSH